MLTKNPSIEFEKGNYVLTVYLGLLRRNEKK